MAPGKIPFLLFFFFDFVFFVFVTLVFSAFVYWTNYGDVRLYILFSTAAGFCLYQLTLGRIVMFFSEAAAEAVRRIFGFLVVRPLRWAAGIFKKAVVFPIRNAARRLRVSLSDARRARITERRLRSLEQEILFDFELSEGKWRS